MLQCGLFLFDGSEFFEEGVDCLQHFFGVVVGVERGLAETGLAVLEFLEDALGERAVVPHVGRAGVDARLYHLLGVLNCLLESVQTHQLQDPLLVEELPHHWQRT